MNYPPDGTKRFRSALAACLLALACGAAPAPAAQPIPASWNIGLEGDVTMTLARDDFQPRPLDDRTPLVLRIENITPAEDGGFVYTFHYMGLESGDYQLADYLMLPDGSPATDLRQKILHVSSMLPEDHDGALPPHAPKPFPWIGGYRILLALLGLFWLGGLAAFVWFGRKRKPPVVKTVADAPLTFAEQIHPLVSAAAKGELSTTNRARLERLLTGYWREKLQLPDQRMADTLAELKRHDEAGRLLRALERWLHRPGGATEQEVRELLEPYHKLPEPKTGREVAT